MTVGEISAELPPLATRLRAALAALGEPRTVDTLASELLARQLSVTRATAGLVVLLSSDGAFLELVAHSGYAVEDLAGWQRSRSDLDLPLHRAVRDNRPIVVSSMAELTERFPQARPFDDSPHALAALPLCGPDGQMLGAIGLRFDVTSVGAHDLDQDVLAGEMLALVAGGQMGQVRAIAPLRQRVEQLQRALDSRVAIEQAKGVLAERHGIGFDEAFERLRGEARRRRVKLQSVAVQVIEGDLLL